MKWDQLYYSIEKWLLSQRQRRGRRKKKEVQTVERIEGIKYEDYLGVNQKAEVYGYAGNQEAERREWFEDHLGKIRVVWLKVEKETSCIR